ncbi:MAG: hypothetical protein P4L76_16855 [Beijerinckiaceae bacterium]|nr:hypothetical protein [Beijerinckiaceae bacterium]
MILSINDLSAIDDVLNAPDAGATAFAALRAQFPTLTLTRCDASDMTEAPFRTYRQFDLHLIDSSDHCVRIVPDITGATGIILARKEGMT